MRVWTLVGLLLLCGVSGNARAAPRTWSYLTTGNGYGFQVYDTNNNKIITFLEHPYRYIKPRPDPKSDGYGRRDLAFDVFFGLKSPGVSGWLKNGTPSSDTGYVDETNIIRVPVNLGGVNAESYYFSPFGYEGNVLIGILKAPGATDGHALFNFHMGDPGDNPDNPSANGEVSRGLPGQNAVIETGPGGGAMVLVGLTGLDRVDCEPSAYQKVQMGQELGTNANCSRADVVPVLSRRLGGDGMWAVAAAYVENAADAEAEVGRLKTWAAGRSAEQILNDAKAEWEKWRKPIPMAVNPTPEERRVWRQGEATLRMGQVLERNTETRKNNGMVLASLPPGEWHTGWVRDAHYAIVALARAGHHAEAKRALEFFLNAGPVGKFRSYVENADYRISVVRYFGNGEEEGDFSGQPTPNVETDGWGMTLWSARQYVDASGDVAWLDKPTQVGGKVYDVLKKGIADAMEKNQESNGIMKPDASIWEVHWERRKHYAYTTLAAYRGFCDMATLASRASRMEDVKKYQALAQKVEAGFFASFLDRNGAIGGSVEQLAMNQYADAAVVEAFTWGMIVDPKGRTAIATLDLLNRLRVESGGFKRLEGSSDTYDLNEWILIDLRMSDAMRRAGRVSEANGLVNLVVEKATANFHLLPELFNAVRANGQIGSYTGSIPMVGYGGGAFILTLLNRAGIKEPDDCGASVISADGGVVETDGGVRRPDPMVPGGSPSERQAACICRVGSAPGSAGAPLSSGVFLAMPWVVLLCRWLRRRTQGRV